jgi:adenylate kinase family enzyme
MSVERPRRIHVTGGAGSGKTWLAARIAKALGVDVIDLDGRGLQLMGRTPPATQEEHDELIARREADLDQATAVEAWVCDGSFVGYSAPHFERAELIVWMDAPWRVASYRIVTRHAKAELRRNNRFPGWRRMVTFWRWSRRFYRDANPPGLNQWGTPATRAATAEVVSAYGPKVVHVRTRREVREVLRRFGA